MIKVKSTRGTTINGVNLRMGENDISPEQYEKVKADPRVTLVDGAGDVAAPLGEFIIDRVCTGDEAKRIHADMVAHIQALTATDKAPEPVSPIGVTPSLATADKASERRTKPRADAQGES